MQCNALEDYAAHAAELSFHWKVGFVGITFTLYRDNSRKLYDFYTIEAKTE